MARDCGGIPFIPPKKYEPKAPEETASENGKPVRKVIYSEPSSYFPKELRPKPVKRGRRKTGQDDADGQ